MDKKKITDFTVKGPILLYLEEDRSEQKSGCSILDVVFSDPVAIGEIAFRNYYTAYVSISCKKVPVDKDVRNRDALPWQVLLKHHVLMKDPHCEQGSQDIIVLNPKVSPIPWNGVVFLRIVLKQPSAHWRKFGIEDLIFYKEMPSEQQPSTYIPRMFAATKPEIRNGFQDKGCTKDSVNSAGDAPATLQTLKNITELMKTMHTGATVGRFEIDGSYDVSHLI